MPEGSQDKRIRQPKLEKGKERKFKRKKKKTKKCNFIVNIEESVRKPSVPNLPGVQTRRRFFYYFGGGWWVVDGGWGTTFWFFKSLDINMVYTLDVYVYI